MPEAIQAGAMPASPDSFVVIHVQRALPSTVRLQALDQCDRLRPHSLDAVGRVFSIEVFAGKDRECGVSRGLVRGIGENQLPREMIETRSDIVNAVPENRRETPRGRFVDDEKHVAKFLVVLKRDSADVTCEVSVALFSESLYVLLCPVEFEANAVQGMRHEVDSAYGEETEDTKGPRDPDSEARRLPPGPEESRRAGTEEVTPPPPAEVASRTTLGRRRGGYSARRTRSGNPEDA